MTAYPRYAVLNVFGLSEQLLPLAASLIGNDFVDSNALAPFHAYLMPGRTASGGPLIEAVCAHVRRVSEIVVWQDCDEELAPALWEALDPNGLITMDVRAKIRRSMAQYALPPLEETVFASQARGRQASPKHTDERTTSESSRGPRRPALSPLLLRRFHQGFLDSAIYTAASLRAIWRGAGIEPIGCTPAVVSCAPLRAEVYAICVSHECGDPKHGANRGDSCDTPKVEEQWPEGCVREYLLYSGKERPEIPDLVKIPDPLAKFDQLHGMKQEARCRILLKACARASGGDDPLLNLDATSLVASGPLMLTVLTLRFLLRRGLLVAGPSMLALLAQSIVLARLDVLRERLPPDERGRQLASCPTVDALRASSLFLRAATDVLLLNSACCDPLEVAGAWQFYDGPLFHWMHDAASRGSGGRELMRNDPLLYRLLCSLRPIAFATTDQASLMNAACADVAKRWRENAHPHDGRGASHGPEPPKKVQRSLPR